MLNTDLFESFEIELPEHQLRSAIHRKLEKDPQQVRGFRSAADMPFTFLVKKVGTDFLEPIFQDVLTRCVDEKIAQMGVEVAGQMQITGLWSQHDRPIKYRYRIEFEKYPVFEVQGLDTIKMPIIKPNEIGDAQVDTAIEMLRRSNSEWKTVARAAQTGDRITVDFDGILEDGESFPGGQAQNVDIDLGSGGMLPEFESGLVGMTPGDERNISLTFPHDYQTPVLAGKAAVFSVLVTAVKEFDLISLDDEFAKKVGARDVPHMREGMRDHLIKEHAAQDERDVQGVLFRQLQLANASVPVPNGLMAAQIHAAQLDRAKQIGIPPDQLPIDESAITEAHSRVHLAVVVRRLVTQEKLKIDTAKDFNTQVVDWLKWRAMMNANPSMQE